MQQPASYRSENAATSCKIQFPIKGKEALKKRRKRNGFTPHQRQAFKRPPLYSSHLGLKPMPERMFIL